MSYLKFDKNLMINLEQSLPKEMLRTNQSGAYHCSSIVGCNTRKQHGLLVVPIGEGEYKPAVLLSSLDETVIQHGAPFNLGLHRYQGGVYSPNGHKYIREFDCESVPRTTYRVGGVILTKEVIFISNEARVLIRYTLLEAHSPTTLELRPFLAFRDINSLVMANDKANTHCEPCDNGVACCLYEGYPNLFMQLSRKNEFVYDPHWYNNIEYVKDLDRGVPYTEDLMVPGRFVVNIKKGDVVIFSAGLSEANPKSFAAMYDKELASRTCRTSFFNCLKNAAKQLYLKEGDREYMLSGYPWGKILARNTFMSLPGNTIAIDHRADFEAIMGTAIKALDAYMDTLATDDKIQGIDLPDIPVWAIWAVQMYAKYYGIDETAQRYTQIVTDLLDFIIAGKHPNLFLQESGLLATDGSQTPASWMNSVWDGKPLVPRSGLLVEVNALWYNALRFACDLTAANDSLAERRQTWADIADRAGEAFKTTFINDYGYLYDYVDGSYADPSVRPNMAIAIGLDHSPLDRSQRKAVLDVVTRELLTPKGLRSLSPKSYGYRPFYLGSPEEREKALHNGPARPWLMGFYAEAYLKVFGRSGVSYIDRMLIGFDEEMSQGCIGSLSQLYDGNPPFAGRGAVSHGTNIAEVLLTIRTLRKFDADNI